MPLDERVLVIPDSHFQKVGAFEGFRPADEQYQNALLNPKQYSFLARHDCEHDPNFKQLIPYIILTCAGQIFRYRRGTKGTETRLQALRSIGIGGHISEADAAGDGDAYRLGLERELAEEVETAAIVQREVLGFIYDPRTPVGQVHLGIVHRFELAEATSKIRDEALTDAGFETLDAILMNAIEYESWSQLSAAALKAREESISSRP